MEEKIHKRAKNIDLFKAILVLVMVLGHVFLLIAQTNSIFYWIGIYANLTCFSGFLFCFGYSTYVAYLTKDFDQVKNKLLKNIYKLIIVFYISGVTYDLLIEKNYEILNYVKILVFLKLPGYSEFLAAFAILNLCILVFFKFLKKITESKKALIICAIISVLSTFMPYEKINFPWANLLIGTLSTSFPILQYTSLFLIGIYFAKYKPKFDIRIFLFTIICSVFYIIKFKAGIEPIAGRFPPRIAFIVGSYMFLYLYYYITLWICSKFSENKILDFIAFIRKRYNVIIANKQYYSIYWECYSYKQYKT